MDFSAQLNSSLRLQIVPFILVSLFQKTHLNHIKENALQQHLSFAPAPKRHLALLYQAQSVSSAHHVVGVDGQQQFEFVGVDVDVSLDRVPGPDGPSLKHLGTKRLV